MLNKILKNKTILCIFIHLLLISVVSGAATPKPFISIPEFRYVAERTETSGYHYHRPLIKYYSEEVFGNKIYLPPKQIVNHQTIVREKDFPLLKEKQYLPPKSTAYQRSRISEKVYTTFGEKRNHHSPHLPPTGAVYPPLVHLPTNHYRQLTTVYEAKSLDFSFPSEKEREAALSDGRYNPKNVLPIDVDVYSPSNGPTQIFVTIPRFDKGPPYSLALIRHGSESHSGMHLEAYPDYSWHNTYGNDCDGLTSIYRIKIDACHRMWILDSGEIGRNHTCPPQIVVFDISSHRIVHRYRLPSSVFVRNYSRLITIAVDILDPPPFGRCQKAFAYIADATSFAIIVYDMVHNHSWRVENRFTYPSPLFSKLTVAGESFQLLDGVFGLSITPNGLGLRRMLYFHSVSNDIQASVPLDVINNATNFLVPDISASLDNFTEVGKRGIQCSVSEITPQGYLLCGFLDPIALVGWDIRTPYTSENHIILAENPETLQFLGGLKVAPNAEGKLEVWILSNRAQKFFSGTNNFNEINYRILKCGLDELLLGLPC